MATTRAVEEVSISGKTRKKTSVFWSTVPKNEQFRNVQVPGVALSAKRSSQAHKYVQVVQKSKSDCAILNARSNSLTVRNQAKVGHKLTVNQNVLVGKQKDASSIFKGAASSDQLANMSSMSESSTARRASLKNLNVEDKKRVANLIKELAKTGEERELALERLQEERMSFEERLSAVQDEQTSLRQERESLKQRLEKSEKLLKKYENELKDVKTEKEQDKSLRKKSQAQPQSTQTSPLIQTTDETTKSRRFKSLGDLEQMKKSRSTQGDESNDRSTRDGRIGSSTPQLPVYSNSLFDVKVSNVEHSNGLEQHPSELRSVSEEYQRSGVTESDGLHELYLREYSLQLRLQEQQIEIQRQQVHLQQQLQLLQRQQRQQQDLAQQRLEHNEQRPHQEDQRQKEQHLHHHQQQQEELSHKGHKQRQQSPANRSEHNQQQRQEERHFHLEQQDQRELSHEGHKQQTQEWPKQPKRQTQHSQNIDQEHQPLQEQRPLNQQSYGQHQNLHQQEPRYFSGQSNETISEQRSPTQQTNLLQKRTPERKSQRIEPKHRTDNAPHEPRSPLAGQKHNHHTNVVKTSRQDNEAIIYGQPQNRDRPYIPQEDVGSTLRYPYHHLGYGDEKPQTVGEYHTNRSTGQHGHYYSEQHYDMTKKTSPRKHHQPKDGKQIDFNNNEYFQARLHSPKHLQNHYDVNGNLVQEQYHQEYLSDPNEPYSESDTDEEHYNCSSERRCHCGYYHDHIRQQHLTSKYIHPVSNHGHSKDIPQHTSPNRNRTSPHSITENPHQPRPVQTYQQLNRHQHSPHRTNSYHKRLLHDPNHAQLHETELSLSNRPEYRHHTRDEQLPQGNDHYRHVQHYEANKHEREPDIVYQTLQETSIKHRPTERGLYVSHQSGFPTHSAIPRSRHSGETEYTYPASEELEQNRESHKTKALLDDYIYNHQTIGEYDTKSNTDNDPKGKIKRVISRKDHDQRSRKVDTIQGSKDDHLARQYTTSRQSQDKDKDLNPGYSLYKPNIPQTPEKQSEQHSRTSPGHKRYSRSTSKSYPNSLVEIVEDLEINSGYEESYSEETEYSAEGQGYDSEEEESTVLDNIFFLKR